VTRYKEGFEMEKRVPNTVDVAISMSPNLLRRLTTHLERLGENNRSGWVRSAIISKMSREIEALREPEEAIY